MNFLFYIKNNNYIYYTSRDFHIQNSHRPMGDIFLLFLCQGDSKKILPQNNSQKNITCAELGARTVRNLLKLLNALIVKRLMNLPNDKQSTGFILLLLFIQFYSV